MSHASKSRLSQYSTGSIPSRSRPVSHIFPVFPSSLPYTLVRDFAYPVVHPMHYGPLPEPPGPPSGLTTPSSESQRRLSDPPASWESKMSWGTSSWDATGNDRGDFGHAQQFADGPPWSEDEDLHSPVVSSRHRKHKSSSATYGSGDATILHPDYYDRGRGFYAGARGDGSERYYVSQGDQANGPGGAYVTYPPDQARYSNSQYHPAQLQPRQYGDQYRTESDDSSAASSPRFRGDDQSRYSRDYQFTITSPDEEMHGKAVALFDFERENENELPLVEGQIIWVSYRHGQGWLVAEDPKTQESGLVPEEYVRLLRDIEGGMTSLTGVGEGSCSPEAAGTPTQAEHSTFGHGHTPTPSNAPDPNNSHNHNQNHNQNNSSTGAGGPNGGGYHQPIVSTFSTSSKDLDPYPQHLLGTQAGQAPPQVVHYHGQRGGSQANTPILQSHQDTGVMRRGSQDPGTATARPSGSEPDAAEGLQVLSDAAMQRPALKQSECAGSPIKMEVEP